MKTAKAVAEEFFATQGPVAADPHGLTPPEHNAIVEHARRGGESVMKLNGDIVYETPRPQPPAPQPPPPPPAPRAPRGRGVQQ